MKLEWLGFVLLCFAWVLWSRTFFFDNERTTWERVEAVDTKGQCVALGEKQSGEMMEVIEILTPRVKSTLEAERLPTGTVLVKKNGRLFLAVYSECWPDTVDPRK